MASFCCLVLLLLPLLLVECSMKVKLQINKVPSNDPEMGAEWEAMKQRMIKRAAVGLAARSGLPMTEAMRTLTAEVESAKLKDDSALSSHPAMARKFNAPRRHDYELQREMGKKAFREHSKAAYGDICQEMEERGELHIAAHCRLAREMGCGRIWKEGAMIRIEDEGFRSSIARRLGRRYTVDNPALRLWCDWAEDAEFVSSHDTRTLGSLQGERGFAIRRDIVLRMFSYAIPTPEILRSIVKHSPPGGLIDVGGYPGMWARLIVDAGAKGTVVVVDNVENNVKDTVPSAPELYYPTTRMDAVNYLRADRLGGADKALLFVWPHNRKMASVWEQKDEDDGRDRETYAYQCLEVYKGDVVFFVGEINRGVTFDMDKYMNDRKKTWREVERMKVPNWPGFDDLYIVYKRISRS